MPLARGGEKKKSEIPAWKQALIEKKEAERQINRSIHHEHIIL